MGLWTDQKRTAGLLLLAVAFFLHFSNIGGLSIYALDEAKNATAAIEMYQRGEWVVPTFNAQYRFDKPPLHYYFFILSYRIFGINEFAARFFPALLGFLTLWLTYRFATRNLGQKTGLLTLLVLVSSLHWCIQFHMAVPDPFLVFFMTASMMAFFEWSRSGFREAKYMWGTYIFLALAVLSKGPVGVLIPVMVFLVFGVVHGMLNQQRLRRIFHPLGLGLFFLIALPWYVLVAVKTDGIWVEEFFFKHNLGRFSAPMEGHGGGVWLTWLFVWAGMLPFSLFLPQSIWYTLKFRGNKVLTYAVIVALTIIVFFMFAGTKLPNYTVPAYPFLGILIGNYLVSLVQSPRRKALAVPVLMYVLLLLCLPFGVFYGLREDPWLSVPDSILWSFMLAWAVIPVIGWALYTKKLEKVFALMGVGFVIVSVVFFWYAFPKIDLQNPVFAGGKEEMAQSPIYYYKIYNPAFSFYLKKPFANIEELAHLSEAKGYVITRKQYLEEFQKLQVPYQLVFEGKDLFESPTTVILQLGTDQ